MLVEKTEIRTFVVNTNHNQWRQLHASRADEIIQLNVALKQKGIKQLQKYVDNELSNPESTNYGNYLTLKQIGEYVKPKPQIYNLVYNWFKQAGAININPTINKEFLTVQISTSNASRAFTGTGINKFHIYEHKNTGHRIQRLSTSYSTAISKHIDLIQGDGSSSVLFNFIHFKPYTLLNLTVQSTYSDKTESAIGLFPALYAPTNNVYPSTIWKQYNVPKGSRGTNPKNGQAVFEGELQFISNNDTQTFYKAVQQQPEQTIFHGLNLPPNKVFQISPTLVDQGEVASNGAGVESQADLEIISSVAPGVQTTVWYVSGPGPAQLGGLIPFKYGAYLLEWAMEVANTTKPPL
ncbi:unnamed protein product, partial [Didymodactylos carnosus]